VVLEEFLVGQEASYFVLADGESYVRMSSAQDHKRIHDDDRGPNTGGMGAFAPSPLLDAGARAARPRRDRRALCSTGCAGEGPPIQGVPLRRLDAHRHGPRVVEFNVRFGDPEAQVILPMLDEEPRAAADGRGHRHACRRVPAKDPRRAAGRRSDRVSGLSRVVRIRGA
jgi:phosphoribosylamine--glycine ligase